MENTYGFIIKLVVGAALLSYGRVAIMHKDYSIKEGLARWSAGAAMGIGAAILLVGVLSEFWVATIVIASSVFTQELIKVIESIMPEWLRKAAGLPPKEDEKTKNKDNV